MGSRPWRAHAGRGPPRRLCARTRRTDGRSKIGSPALEAPGALFSALTRCRLEGSRVTVTLHRPNREITSLTTLLACWASFGSIDRGDYFSRRRCRGMGELVTKISVFVGSPSDVQAERDIIRQTIDDLNITFAPSRRLVLELKQWDTHVWPGFGDDAQAVINARIGAFVIFIGVFWNRFGTPTGRAESGSVEEFQRAYARWKEHRRPSLLLYFRRTPVDLSTVEAIEQKRRLLEFKSTLTHMGALFREYTDLDEFRRVINLHLTQELMALEKTDEIQRLHERITEQQGALTKQERTLQEQQQTINKLVMYSMAHYIFRHLSGIYHGQRGERQAEYLFRNDEPMRHDLRFLRDHGYIEDIEIGDLHDKENLVKRIKLTPVGRYCVEMREGIRGDKT